MRGYIEHDGANCLLGEHSNRVTTREMCPIFLELRRTRLKYAMRDNRLAKTLGMVRAR